MHGKRKCPLPWGQHLHSLPSRLGVQEVPKDAKTKEINKQSGFHEMKMSHGKLPLNE